MPDYVNYNQLLTMGHRRRGGAVLSLLFAVVMITILVVSNVHGDINLETKKHWGYVIACDHILYIHGVTVTECAEECLYRMNCKSVNYIVQHKYCELCANETNNGYVRRNGGVHRKRSNIEQDTLTQICDCTHKDTCCRCEMKECGKPPLIGPRSKCLGNRRTPGSKIKYFCEVNEYRYNYAQSTCLGNGTWTVPNIWCHTLVYEGCYVDTPVRVLNERTWLINNSMTIEMCEVHCIQQSYPYFGMEASYHCFCGWMLPFGGTVKDTECNTNCIGNTDQMCGGQWRLSIYLIQ